MSFLCIVTLKIDNSQIPRIQLIRKIRDNGDRVREGDRRFYLKVSCNSKYKRCIQTNAPD
ncbi:MAG: hypothetical protein AAGA60_32135 [Cyanobacteria bacterium P01_E01_bin.42]